MAKLRTFSGKDICKLLEQNGFVQVRQRGSHIVMQKRTAPPRIVLDAEEVAILASVELGEWQSVPDVSKEIRYQRYAAQAQPDRLAAVNIELSASDLESLETLAQQSGVSVSLN